MVLVGRHFRRQKTESMIPDRYNARDAEPRWQRIWDEREIFATSNDSVRERPKYYVLEMFPYPSGRKCGAELGHERRRPVNGRGPSAVQAVAIRSRSSRDSAPSGFASSSRMEK